MDTPERSPLTAADVAHLCEGMSAIVKFAEHGANGTLAGPIWADALGRLRIGAVRIRGTDGEPDRRLVAIIEPQAEPPTRSALIAEAKELAKAEQQLGGDKLAAVRRRLDTLEGLDPAVASLRRHPSIKAPQPDPWATYDDGDGGTILTTK